MNYSYLLLYSAYIWRFLSKYDSSGISWSLPVISITVTRGEKENKGRVWWYRCSDTNWNRPWLSWLEQMQSSNMATISSCSLFSIIPTIGSCTQHRLVWRYINPAFAQGNLRQIVLCQIAFDSTTGFIRPLKGLILSFCWVSRYPTHQDSLFKDRFSRRLTDHVTRSNKL